MKKTILFSLVMCVLLSFVACGPVDPYGEYRNAVRQRDAADSWRSYIEFSLTGDVDAPLTLSFHWRHEGDDRAVKDVSDAFSLRWLCLSDGTLYAKKTDTEGTVEDKETYSTSDPDAISGAFALYDAIVGVPMLLRRNTVDAEFVGAAEDRTFSCHLKNDVLSDYFRAVLIAAGIDASDGDVTTKDGTEFVAHLSYDDGSLVGIGYTSTVTWTPAEGEPHTYVLRADISIEGIGSTHVKLPDDLSVYTQR